METSTENTYEQTCEIIVKFLKANLHSEIQKKALTKQPFVWNKNGYGCDNPTAIWTKQGPLTVKQIEQSAGADAKSPSPLQKIYELIEKEVKSAKPFVEQIHRQWNGSLDPLKKDILNRFSFK